MDIFAVVDCIKQHTTSVEKLLTTVTCVSSAGTGIFVTCRIVVFHCSLHLSSFSHFLWHFSHFWQKEMGADCFPIYVCSGNSKIPITSMYHTYVLTTYVLTTSVRSATPWRRETSRCGKWRPKRPLPGPSRSYKSCCLPNRVAGPCEKFEISEECLNTGPTAP